MQIQKNDYLNSSVAQADLLPDSAHLRPKACAQLMGISIATFWRLVSKGKLKTHKLTDRTTSVRIGDLREFMAGKVGG